MKTILLISEKTLKSNTLIDDNVDGKFIVQAIKDAQIFLRDSINNNVYDRICKGVEENNLTNEERELLDNYIQPYLCYKVMSTICIPLSYKFRNTGVVQNVEQHFQQSSSMKDLTYVAKHYSTMADSYLSKIKLFTGGDDNCTNAVNNGPIFFRK